MLARLPLRVRLAAAFALAMTILLAATGLFVYFRLESALDGTLNAGLRTRARDLASLVKQAEPGLADTESTGLLEPDDGYAQVFTTGGSVVDASPQLGSGRLLDPAQLERAASGPILVDRGPIGADDEASRVLGIPVVSQNTRLVVAVSASLEPREEALGGLRTQLLIGGPLALILASLAGYGLAAAALRPVESMRARAARISGSEPGQRLPVPAADDEIRRLGLTLNDMLDRIESTLRRERRFAADASHELRTPLALLRTELELAGRRERTRDELVAVVQSATEETERLTKLAEDLLVLARADDGRLHIRHEAISVRPLLEDAANRFAARAQEAGRAIVVDATDVTLHGDRLRLEQALDNLLDNALRYGAGQVQLSTVAGDEVRLHVRDDGPGFDPAFIPRAFERFTRADEARGKGGTGLGLAIVDAIARAHGGSAGTANRVPHGANVWIALPLVASNKKTHASATPAR